MVHPKARGKPTIIAVRHLSNSEQGEEPAIRNEAIVLSKFLDRLSEEKKRRTLYLEASPRALQDFEEMGLLFRALDPFSNALLTAKRQKWRIVLLDNKEDDRNAWLRPWISALRKRFDNKNLREKKWASIVQGAREGDIVVMHPDHVRGFLIESGFSGRSVLWISNRPPRGNWERLGSKERRRIVRDTIPAHLRRKGRRRV